MCSEESETTLMAQKQKVKVVAKAGKHSAPKAAGKPSTAKSSVAKALRAKAIPVKSKAAMKTTAKPARNKPALKVKPKTVIAAKAATKPAPVKKPVPVKAKLVLEKHAVAKHAAAKHAPKAVIAAKVHAPKVAAVKPAAPAHVGAKTLAAPAPVQRAVPATIGKPAGQKITAPVPTASSPVPATPRAIAEKAAAARGMMAAQKKPVSARHGFRTNEFVVYPAHGVGRIVGIEEQEIAGMSLELFVITFDKEKLTLRVPTGKLSSVGMRKLAEDGIVKRAMETLKGRARVKRTMWSRRAQEYVAKINSGDLISIAEVVRDLYRSEAQPEQSYSERQLYEDALERMAREIAAVERLDERGAVQRIVEILSKSAKGRRLAAETAEAAEVKAA